MNAEGPLLETLTRRLAECPADFLAEPRLGKSGLVHVDAVVSDLLRELGGEPLSPQQAALFQSKESKRDRNRLRLVLLACWLLRDSWFTGKRQFAKQALIFLIDGVTESANLTPAPNFVNDPDRREELSRLCSSPISEKQTRGLTEAFENASNYDSHPEFTAQLDCHE